MRGLVTRGLLRLLTNRPGGSWQGALDYIFTGPGLRPLDCRIILEHPAPRDPRLYASDHRGLVATLAIEPSGGLA